MADNPDIQWALKLLEPYEEKNLLYKHGVYITCGIVGFGSALIMNFMRGRPIYSGMQQHIGLTLAVPLVFGTFYNKVIKSRDEEQAAVTRDYIIKHPQDFIQAPPLKYADCFEPWSPIR